MSDLELDALSARYRFLGVHVRSEWIKASAWLDANPKRHPRNLARFFVNWLNKATQTQDARLLAERMRHADPYGYREAMQA